MLEIIESTLLQDFPDVWCDRKIRSIDYHPGPTGHGTVYVHYYQLTREKIDRQTTWSPSNDTRVVTDDLPPGWIHDDADIDRTPRDKSCDDG